MFIHDLPSSGQFFRLKMFTPPNSSQPGSQVIPRIPDMRNLLLWNPNVRLKSGQSESHVFFTGDTPGEYMAIIRGVDELGNEISNWCEFTVK
jgi:hypothetical protein